MNASEAPWRLAEYAQAKLGIRVDGVWGAQTEAAYLSAPPAVREDINRRMAAKGLSSYSVARVTTTVRKPGGVSSRAPVTAPATMRQPVLRAGSGWQGRLLALARGAGIPEATISALINQVRVETGGRLTISEQMTSYSNNWLRDKMRVFKSWSDERINALKRSGEEAFFNVMYGGRSDLGNRGVESGDGYRYRGRGALQLTGRYNYERVGRLLGVDLLADPDWVVRTEDNAVASAIAFLKSKGRLTAVLSSRDMARLVNPGLV